MADVTTEGTTATPAEEPQTPETAAPSQKPERTEKEKAEFSLKKNAERLRELGGDPTEALGIRPQITLDEDLDDDKPLTVKDFRNLQKRDAHQTAIQLAEQLGDDERDTVKDILSSRIVPSGDAQRDLKEARAIANADRNAKILEEASRKGIGTRTAAGGSAPAGVEDDFIPTETEARMMQPPYNLSREKILAIRQKEQAK